MLCKITKQTLIKNPIMYQVTVDYAKANLEELCDRTEKEPDGVAIIRENRSYILITQEKWESFYSCKTRYGE
jgi:PHD/YefM family antitoxin component YafN of YafNO toxin-antitoxin module